MPNFARRLKREAKWQFMARSLGTLVIGFLSWSGLLILLDLYDAFSPIQETEISSWMVGAVICSSLLLLGLLLYTWFKRPNSRDLGLGQGLASYPAILELFTLWLCGRSPAFVVELSTQSHGQSTGSDRRRCWVGGLDRVEWIFGKA
jgi:hypothetical protein